MEEQKTPGMRIRALREMKFQSIRNLAEQAGISPSTLGRIETGAMKSIGSETLAKLATALDVSADYILGLTPVQKRRNMDIVATGLSEESVRRLIHRTVDTDIVNRLMEHKSFPLLTKYIRMYFSNQTEYGMQARNSLFDLATDELRNMALSPEQKREAMESAVLLKSQKTAPHEAEMEKIKTTFLAILKDIKRDLESEQPTSPPIQMQVFQAILQTAGSTVAVPPDLDAFLDKLIAVMRQTCPMSDESARLFKALFQSMIADKAASQRTQA